MTSVSGIRNCLEGHEMEALLEAGKELEATIVFFLCESVHVGLSITGRRKQQKLSVPEALEIIQNESEM